MTAKRDLTQSDLAAIAATPTPYGEPADFDQAPVNGGHVAARKPLQLQPAPALRSSTSAVATRAQTPAKRVVNVGLKLAADSDDEAEHGLAGALGNIVGGDILAFEILGVKGGTANVNFTMNADSEGEAEHGLAEHGLSGALDNLVGGHILAFDILHVTRELGANNEIADDFDLRGYAFWHVRDGRVLTSGSSPELGEYHELHLAKYQKGLSDRMGSELYIRKGTLGAPAQDFSERIMGMTWDEIMAKQMRVKVITRIKPATLPVDAIRVYDGSGAPADDDEDVEAEAPRC